jgi:hypothetical protein
MSRLFGLLLVVAAACGGPKPRSTGVPLPPDHPAEPVAGAGSAADKPAAKPAEPAEPAPPAQGPVEVTVPANKTTVKLVSPGKGKREPLKFSSKAGDKQQIELALDFAVKQAENGKPAVNQIYPTTVLGGEAETKSVDKDGTSTFALTVSSTDARDTPGSQIPLDKYKPALATLQGLVITSTLDAHGQGGDVGLKLDKAGEEAAGVLSLVTMAMPPFPALPTEPVGIGAKWLATTTAKFAGKLEITQTTTYELVAHKGATWTVKGTTVVTGTDQENQGAKISGIKGTGTSEATLADGKLYPTTKSVLTTEFTASDPNAGSVVLALTVGGAVSPPAGK